MITHDQLVRLFTEDPNDGLVFVCGMITAFLLRYCWSMLIPEKLSEK
jgi:hypothetical protein